mgnify:CR=1 FL=1
MLTKEQTKEIVAKFGKTPTDSGSPEVQVAILTEKIKYLTSHFADHKHDYHSKRGMMKMIGQRRRVLSFIKKQDVTRYQKVIADLGLRK